MISGLHPQMEICKIQRTVENFLRGTVQSRRTVVRYATNIIFKNTKNMETKKTFLYIACIVLFIKAAKTIWELINFSQIPELNNIGNSLP